MIYPDYHATVKQEAKEIIINIETYVRFKYKGEWYKSFVQERAKFGLEADEEHIERTKDTLIKKLIKVCYNIQLFGIPEIHEPKEYLQISEKLRMKLINADDSGINIMKMIW